MGSLQNFPLIAQVGAPELHIPLEIINVIVAIVALCIPIVLYFVGNANKQLSRINEHQAQTITAIEVLNTTTAAIGSGIHELKTELSDHKEKITQHVHDIDRRVVVLESRK